MELTVVEKRIDGEDVYIQSADAEVEHEEDKVAVVVEADAVHHPGSEGQAPPAQKTRLYI